MPGKSVDIRSGRLFPFPFLVLGGAVFFSGMAMLISQPILGVVLMLGGALVLTAHEGTEINPVNHTYREYNSFLFMKNGEEKKYNDIEKIFVNSAKVSQRVYTAHTLKSSTFTNVEYNAYLKFGDGVKVFLMSRKNKTKLLEKLRDLSRSLNTTVVDHTVPG